MFRNVTIDRPIEPAVPTGNPGASVDGGICEASGPHLSPPAGSGSPAVLSSYFVPSRPIAGIRRKPLDALRVENPCLKPLDAWSVANLSFDRLQELALMKKSGEQEVAQALLEALNAKQIGLIRTAKHSYFETRFTLPAGQVGTISIAAKAVLLPISGQPQWQSGEPQWHLEKAVFKDDATGRRLPLRLSTSTTDVRTPAAEFLYPWKNEASADTSMTDPQAPAAELLSPRIAAPAVQSKFRGKGKPKELPPLRSSANEAARTEFANRERSNTEFRDPRLFNLFLEDLNKRTNWEWDTFKLQINRSELTKYLNAGRTEKRFHAATSGAVYRAADPTLKPARKPRLAAPDQEDDKNALAAFRSHPGMKPSHATTNFNLFLLYRREHMKDVPWDKFLNKLSVEQRMVHLDKGVKDGYFPRAVSMAVLCAVELLKQVPPPPPQ